MSVSSPQKCPVFTVAVERRARLDLAFFQEFWTYPETVRVLAWRSVNVLFPAKLPGRLLSEDDDHLDLIAGFHGRSWIRRPGHDAHSIRLKVQGGLSDSPMWPERRPGLLAPEIPWRNLSV